MKEEPRLSSLGTVGRGWAKAAVVQALSLPLGCAQFTWEIR